MRLNPIFRKALATNANTSSFTAKTTAVLVKPSGNLVYPVSLQDGGGVVPSRMRVLPYGLGSNNDAFDMRIWGWYRGRNPDTWFSIILSQFSCTISNYVGVAGGMVLNTERFADTIALTALIGEPTLTSDVTRFGTIDLYTPANDTPAYIELPLREVELLEFDFDQTTGTPTCNALLQFLTDEE